MLTIFLFGALVGGTFGGLMMAALAVGGRADRDAHAMERAREWIRQQGGSTPELERVYGEYLDHQAVRRAREDYQRTAERMTEGR